LRNPVLAEAAQSGVPVVLVNRIAEDYSFPAVTVDNERGVSMAIGHLTSLGHERIAYIAGPQDVSTGLARYRGFLAAMAAAGHEVPAEMVAFAAAFSVEEGYRCAQQIIRAGRGATAIAAGNDMLAVGCYAALEEARLTCPDDISVVGFNNMPFIDMLRPPLTTVAFPHYQVGTEAAQLLIGRLNGDVGANKVLFLAPELVIRSSTAPAS
jgi:LacI family transcriptional regulator